MFRRRFERMAAAQGAYEGATMGKGRFEAFSDGVLKRALGSDWKGKLSPVLYLVGIVSSFCVTGLAQAMYLVAALIWLVPDRRIEKVLAHEKH